MEKFKYLMVLFMSKGRMEWEVSRMDGGGSRKPTCYLYQFVVAKRELNWKTKHLI